MGLGGEAGKLPFAQSLSNPELGAEGLLVDLPIPLFSVDVPPVAAWLAAAHEKPDM